MLRSLQWARLGQAASIQGIENLDGCLLAQFLIRCLKHPYDLAV